MRPETEEQCNLPCAVFRPVIVEMTSSIETSYWNRKGCNFSFNLQGPTPWHRLGGTRSLPKSHPTPTYLMASFEDYDEFGNYIGEDLNSDDEEQPFQQSDIGQDLLEKHGEPSEPLEGLTEPWPSNSAMEIDGASLLFLKFLSEKCC